MRSETEYTYLRQNRGPGKYFSTADGFQIRLPTLSLPFPPYLAANLAG